ncbi:Lactoylglutathione lyase-related lyase [Devosia sp. LC5]|uniref:VOC family protein n=1 Tax=Devosia sp. LC5 TaxID=1502724 RepID=UPI0004E46BF1|nr:VOC family protein [Devosia sp. LC5]KFC62903.1 Lactoylglutathione lyase-related lyase [Devosia sp. LC5]
MLGHVSLGVRDLVRTAIFYDAVLAALGYVRLWTGEDGLGYGSAGGGEKLNIFERAGASPPGEGFHLAFEAPDRAGVDRFHAAALAHGGMDAGTPGLRPHYGARYYAAFVVDPEGTGLKRCISSAPSVCSALF